MANTMSAASSTKPQVPKRVRNRSAVSPSRISSGATHLSPPRLQRSPSSTSSSMPSGSNTVTRSYRLSMVYTRPQASTARSAWAVGGAMSLGRPRKRESSVPSAARRTTWP